MEPAGFSTLQKILPVTERGRGQWVDTFASFRSGGVAVWVWGRLLSGLRPEPVISQFILQSAPHSVSDEEDDN